MTDLSKQSVAAEALDIRRARPLLGTIVDIAAGGPHASDAIEAAFAAIADVHRLMSFHDPESDVSRINSAQAGQEIRVDPRTRCVLEFAGGLSEMSGGLFDVTTAPVLIVNGFLPAPAPAPDTNAMPSNSNYHDLELLAGDNVRWRRKGLIDLGGIAKGYAVDRAIASLRGHGVTGAVVNAGGDLRTFGQPQPIYVRHPEQPDLVLNIGMLTNAATATSSGYFSRFQQAGRRLEPLVDPRQGICTEWAGSISVFAEDCMTADALTKVVALDPHASTNTLAQFRAQAVLIDRDGMRSCGERLLQNDLLVEPV